MIIKAGRVENIDKVMVEINLVKFFVNSIYRKKYSVSADKF